MMYILFLHANTVRQRLFETFLWQNGDLMMSPLTNVLPQNLLFNVIKHFHTKLLQYFIPLGLISDHFSSVIRHHSNVSLQLADVKWRIKISDQFEVKHDKKKQKSGRV